MALRAADALRFLAFKETLTESDHVAVFADGRKLPVFYRSPAGHTVKLETGELWVDVGDQWARTNTAGLGVVRYERLPDPQPQVEASPPVESGKLKGSTWEELKADAERKNRKALAEQYESRKAQQTGLTAPDSAFTKASHDLAQVVASQRGQSGPNSKV